jgi:large subunit ribosomal protein L6
MSRIGKAPITVLNGVDVKIDGQVVSIKSGKGELTHKVHADVTAELNDGIITVKPADEGNKVHWAMTGTTRAVLNNMVLGVTDGFQKKLALVGIGYRAAAKGKVLNLALGFSHPVDYPVPEGITIETPSNTEVIISGIDKQQVGQVAAEIRAFRPPEPYKGKGVRYADEHVARKEAKKK